MINLSPEAEDINILHDVHRKICDSMTSKGAVVRALKKPELDKFFKEYKKTLEFYNSVVEELYHTEDKVS